MPVGSSTHQAGAFWSLGNDRFRWPVFFCRFLRIAPLSQYDRRDHSCSECGSEKDTGIPVEIAPDVRGPFDAVLDLIDIPSQPPALVFDMIHDLACLFSHVKFSSKLRMVTSGRSFIFLPRERPIRNSIAPTAPSATPTIAAASQAATTVCKA